VGEPRKRHYVPVFYQKHFSNSKELLWVYDRREKTHKELHPLSVCFQSDMYTLKSKDAPWDRRVESKVLSFVDGMGSRAIRDLLSGNSSSEVIHTIAYFTGVQFYRLPWFARDISAAYVSGAEEMMRLMAVDAGRMQSIMDRYARKTGEPINVSAESMVEAIRGNQIGVVATERPFLTHIFSQAESLTKLIETLNWQILEAPRESGFVICDNPVTVVPSVASKHMGFLVPGTVAYYPLARQHCLRLSGVRSSARRRVSKEKVQIIIFNIAANSERFIMGPDKAQLMSVVTRSGSIELDSKPRHTIGCGFGFGFFMMEASPSQVGPRRRDEPRPSCRAAARARAEARATRAATCGRFRLSGPPCRVSDLCSRLCT
jgi:Protein of unknown function (DUF4238)